MQEALSNVAQHAQARRVAVKVLGCNGTRVVATIQDDGAGFKVANGDGAGSGLHGMRERAMLTGAQLDLRSSPGAGTTVELVLRAKGA